jgi:hypothetical protein
LRAFCERLKGAWWERITVGSKQWLSFLQIELDHLYNSVQLIGRTYNAKGIQIAHWKSIQARVSKEEKKVLYHWQGWYHVSAYASPQDRFQGFGELEFEVLGETGVPITAGQGKYWDVDEAHPEKTVVNPMKLRRIVDGRNIATMTSGKEKDIQQVVVRALRDWHK